MGWGTPCVGHMAQAEAARICLTAHWLPVAALLPLSRDLVGISASNLYGTNDGGHVVKSTTFALCLAANLPLVHLEDVLAADAISVRPDHRGPRFVKHLESGLVA